MAYLGQENRCAAHEQNAVAVAAHRDRVAQDKTQQLAAHEHHADLEHNRISRFGDAEHVSVHHHHAPLEPARCA